jgi:hypothetical protein
VYSALDAKFASPEYPRSAFKPGLAAAIRRRPRSAHNTRVMQEKAGANARNDDGNRRATRSDISRSGHEEMT